MAKAAKRSPAKRTRTARRQPAAEAPAPHFAFLGLTSDWYWEQDAELRFTRVEVRNDAAAEQGLAQRILGKKRWETGVEIEGGWDAHRAVLESRAAFRDVLMWRNLPDGARRYISVSGEPMFDSRGRFTGYRGIGRDISKQKRIQQLLKLDQAVTLRLAEAQGAPQALNGALEAICDSLRWDCSELWTPDAAAGVLRRFAHWAAPGEPGALRFVEASKDLEFRPGAGLVGTVWQTGEPIWVPDFTADARSLRKELAEETGLRAVALFPIRAGDRIAAVLEFTSRRMRQPDNRLWQTLRAIGTQIGQFLGRAEAERAVRESEARWRALTHLSSDWYWELDAEYRFTRLEGRQVAGGDVRAAAPPHRPAPLGERPRGAGRLGRAPRHARGAPAIPRPPHVAHHVRRHHPPHDDQRRAAVQCRRQLRRLPRRGARRHRREARRADPAARARGGAAARRGRRRRRRA